MARGFPHGDARAKSRFSWTQTRRRGPPLQAPEMTWSQTRSDASRQTGEPTSRPARGRRFARPSKLQPRSLPDFARPAAKSEGVAQIPLGFRRLCLHKFLKLMKILPNPSNFSRKRSKSDRLLVLVLRFGKSDRTAPLRPLAPSLQQLDALEPLENIPGLLAASGLFETIVLRHGLVMGLNVGAETTGTSGAAQLLSPSPGITWRRFARLRSPPIPGRASRTACAVPRSISSSPRPASPGSGPDRGPPSSRPLWPPETWRAPR